MLGAEHLTKVVFYLSALRDATTFILINKKCQQSINSVETTPFYNDKNVIGEMKLFKNAKTVTCNYVSIPITTCHLHIYDCDTLYTRCALFEASPKITRITLRAAQYTSTITNDMPLERLTINCLEELNGPKTSQNPTPFKADLQFPSCSIHVICDVSQLDNVMSVIPESRQKTDVSVEVHNGQIVTYYRKGEWVFGMKDGIITMHLQDIPTFTQSAQKYAVEKARIIDFINPEQPAEPGDLKVDLDVKELYLQDLNCPKIALPSTLEKLVCSNCSVVSLKLDQKDLKIVTIEQCADLKELDIETNVVECEAIYLKSLEKLIVPPTVKVLKLDNSVLPITSFPESVEILSVPTTRKLEHIVFPKHLKEVYVNSCFITTLPQICSESITFYQCTFTQKINVKARKVEVNGCFVVSNVSIDAEEVLLTRSSLSRSSKMEEMMEYTLPSANLVTISSVSGLSKIVLPSATELSLTNNPNLETLDAPLLTQLSVIGSPLMNFDLPKLQKFAVDNTTVPSNGKLYGVGSFRLEKCTVSLASQLLVNVKKFTTFSLTGSEVSSICSEKIERLRLYNCKDITEVKMKNCEVIALFDLPKLSTFECDNCVNDLTILKCPNVKLSLERPMKKLLVGSEGEFASENSLEIKGVVGKSIVANAPFVRIEDVTDCTIVLTKNVKNFVCVGSRNVDLKGLEETQAECVDISMSSQIVLNLPKSTIQLLTILECQDVTCKNITECTLLPKQIREDYEKQQYEKVPKDQCIIC
ncbi:hypothetical protein EIN_222290 [Entamoeba invadens IP1]|uniref:Uncharacterized protein n=1 Tax=Entamoeba invadens IP1 TaxID=370355 RepID=A0A0A1U204_ENTIV|nr:hypothetical protein EIN_222290 [Entamoeba invadens IP1]ELP88086.1 hypothetical protein EIN_222290 [Entamoeba invadens IP1]|eukprot:XP_004254857.1 hypothetical protein EIN_222290 [Entamoeba invadens IP1]